MEGTNASVESDSELLAQIYLENYISVVKLDLQTGEARVMKSNLDFEIVGISYPWADLIKRYAQRRVYPPDRDVVLSLTLNRVRDFCWNSNDLPLELRCLTDGDHFQWVEIGFSKIGGDANHVIVTTRNADDIRLIRKIVDLFVYQNYDYLCLIDAKKGSYIRFTGNKDNPVPPERGDNYTETMIRYNRMFVAPEDCERVTQCMQLPHVTEMLDKMEIYSFTSGGITNEGKYRRSRIQFLYYDKAASLILVARTDVTQIYIEEQEKRKQLEDALQTAQLDAMTRLYNQKATEDLVTQSLESQYRNMAAFLFIDVDNFKMVNDSLGHQKGNELLCYLAGAVKDVAGRSGIAGRLGGDEFLLYLPGISFIEEPKQIAKQICGVFKDYPEQCALPSLISCSIGISIYPLDGTDYDTLVQKADQALYTSKRYGKNRYYLYSEQG